MFAFSKKIIDEAENSAIGLHSSLAALRRLSLHDFTEFLFSMPAGDLELPVKVELRADLQRKYGSAMQ